jgi:hypothetical protein
MVIEYFIGILPSDSHILINGCEILSVENSIRNAVKIKFSREVVVYEGELVEYTDDTIVLRTQKSTKTFRISSRLVSELQNFCVGDVLYIEPAAGVIRRLGRSETWSNEYDLEGDKYVQLKKNPVSMTKIREDTVSLYDLDYAYNEYRDGITNGIRDNVDLFIKNSKVGCFVESALIVNDIDKIDLSTVLKILDYSDRYNNLKVLLVGGLSEDMRKKLSKYLFIYVSDEENEERFIDFLKAKYTQLNGLEFETVVRTATKKWCSDIIENILQISNTSIEFENILNLLNKS